MRPKLADKGLAAAEARGPTAAPPPFCLTKPND
jgi:hypothetical protein